MPQFMAPSVSNQTPEAPLISGRLSFAMAIPVAAVALTSIAISATSPVPSMNRLPVIVSPMRSTYSAACAWVVVAKAVGYETHGHHRVNLDGLAVQQGGSVLPRGRSGLCRRLETVAGTGRREDLDGTDHAMDVDADEEFDLPLDLVTHGGERILWWGRPHGEGKGHAVPTWHVGVYRQP